MIKDFLGIPKEFWKFFRNLNVGLFVFLVIVHLFPNQDMSNEDIFLAFFLINTPLLLCLLFALYLKFKEGINGKKEMPSEDLDQADELYEEALDDCEAGKYKLALEKLDKAIELNDVDGWFYYERGHVKDELKDFKGAEEDFTETIRIAMADEQDLIANGYYARAYVRLDLGDKKGACEDWTKAAEMGRENANEALKEYCEE